MLSHELTEWRLNTHLLAVVLALPLAGPASARQELHLVRRLIGWVAQDLEGRAKSLVVPWVREDPGNWCRLAKEDNHQSCKEDEIYLNVRWGKQTEMWLFKSNNDLIMMCICLLKPGRERAAILDIRNKYIVVTASCKYTYYVKIRLQHCLNIHHHYFLYKLGNRKVCLYGFSFFLGG